jgi:hypothetical protein
MGGCLPANKEVDSCRGLPGDGQEERDLFLPDTSYQEFVKAQ